MENKCPICGLPSPNHKMSCDSRKQVLHIQNNTIPTAEEFSKKFTNLRSAVALKDLSDFATEAVRGSIEEKSTIVLNAVKNKL